MAPSLGPFQLKSSADVDAGPTSLRPRPGGSRCSAGTSTVLEGVEIAPDGAVVVVTASRDGEVLAVPLVDGNPTSLADGAWPVAGVPGVGEGQFTAPVDLAFTPDGHLVVTDQALNTVQVFTP